MLVGLAYAPAALKSYRILRWGFSGALLPIFSNQSCSDLGSLPWHVRIAGRWSCRKASSCAVFRVRLRLGL